ncbi:hypothetical protein GCK72_002715 [Caenorhabditis remanei]|uniref:F-box domain-containing protein n=1 Tax=Caenorhabditis remanei TaxID=31234 RepID=A0A6A5HUQ7_CAERE|nr:hypothetical protein GCK72_002715 [Caenorhabditis remanei]KAF1770891.1 hypothetical protein GCK72_002715 [Caenorhabditis remanei]
MTEKPIELSDLPPEILQLLVEKCNFVTRRRLRASSSLMYQVVNSTKLYIPSVKMTLWNKAVIVELTPEKSKDDHIVLFMKNHKGETRMESDFRKEVLVENSDPMDAAIEWFRQMCLQKNVTIGQLHLGNVNKLTEKLEGVLVKSEIRLKIRSILCSETESEDLMWKVMDYCDKSLLKEMKVETANTDAVFELFGKQDGIVKNLEKIEIDSLCNVSDEDVLSLNASVISLKSDYFSDDLVYKLIEKFTNKREDGSAFCIQNSQEENLDLEMIPPGFEETNSTNEYKEYRNQLIDTNHPTVYLRVSDDRVLLQIGDTKKANFWIEDESDSETSDDSDSSPGWESDYNAYDGGVYIDVGNDEYASDPEFHGYHPNHDYSWD